MTEYRRADVRDRESILALRRLCYPKIDPEKLSPRFWDWEFTPSPAGEPSVYIAVEEGECVAHFAFLPQVIRSEGADLHSLLAVDAMTHPRARRRGVYSDLVSFAVAENVHRYDVSSAYQRRPGVLGAMLRNGWVHDFNCRVLVRPLAIHRLLRRSAGEHHSLTEVDDAGVVLLGGDHVTQMAGCASRAEKGGVVSGSRGPEWLSWRLFHNPEVTYRVTGYFERGELAGWLAVRRVNLFNIDTLAIVDLVSLDSDVAQRLLRDAMAVAKRYGVAIAAALVSKHHPSLPLLTRTHFLPSPFRFRHLTNVFNRGVAKVVARPWAISWADTDHV